MIAMGPYPKYQPLGAEWLEQIPAHWEITSLKRIGNLQAGAGFPDIEQGDTTQQIPFFKVGDMAHACNARYMRQYQHTVSHTTARRLRAHIFAPNTIVFAKVGAALMLNRRRMLVRPSCIDNNMMGFSPFGCDPVWAMYWLSGLDMKELANPGAVPSVNESQMRETPVVIGPLPEQRAIANFLDRETARIDALVAKKERLIELLQEKRTALISHAVTKGLPADAAAQAGLDPNVPMKDSGVEWLGTIPAHWEVKRLKHLVIAPLKYGANEPAVYTDNYLPIRITDIREDGTLRDDSFRSIPEEIAKPYLLAGGDILFARSGATVGKTFRYNASWGKAAHARYLIRARFDGSVVESVFVQYFTQTQRYADWLLSNLIQATIQNVSAERYASLSVPFPPLPEQRAIADFLDRETARIDTLVRKVREAIDRLNELRTALISAAVTGKIDVREAPAPDESETSTADGSVMPGASGGIERQRRNQGKLSLKCVRPSKVPITSSTR